MTLSKYQARSLALSLGLFLFSIYLFTYRGGFHSIDEVSMFAVTESLVKFGRLNTDQIAWTQWTTSQAEAQGFFGRDGHVYSKKGLALSLAQAPLYALALIVPGLGMLQMVSLLNGLVTAATGMLLLMFVWRLGYPPFVALAIALIFGLATIAAVYAKYLFSEPLAGFLLLLAAYMLLAYRLEGGLRHIILAGLAAGSAVLARANNLFLIPVFALYLFWIIFSEQAENEAQTGQSRRTWSRFFYPIVAFLLALAVPGAILLAYNALRSGNPFQTGYDLTLFSSNVILGLYKLLFSPLRGLFIYSPILLLALPGWGRLRRDHPAEAWLFAGLSLITLALFSFWSSGEGLSWGSRFLVPLIPFFTLCLAPLISYLTPHAPCATPYAPGTTDHASRLTPHVSRFTFYVLRFTFYALLLLSLLIQSLGVTINPWVFLAQLQADFGGEFFLENTPALYSFRYSQIAGQLQNWSVQHSDLAWWQPWSFDSLAFSLGLLFVLLSGGLLWSTAGAGEQGSRGAGKQKKKFKIPASVSRITYHVSRIRHHPLLVKYRNYLHKVAFSPITSWIEHRHRDFSTSFRNDKVSRVFYLMYNLFRYPTFFTLYCLLFTFYVLFLLLRYYQTDRQFGPPDSAYIQALDQAAALSGAPVITVAQAYYHLPMNRFKARVPLLGFAQQRWPLPETALPLLEETGATIRLVTVGFPPAAADNAVEQWLALHTFKASDIWLPEEVRLVLFSAGQALLTRPITLTLSETVQLVAVKLPERGQAGQLLPVEFVWQVARQPERDYDLFLQLLNREGALVAQHDAPPKGGYTPTSTWQPGQQQVSRHALPLPEDLPAGDYRLIAGLYDSASGARLVTEQGSDFVELDNITIISR